MNLAQLQRFFAAAATSGTGPIAGLGEVFVESPQLPVSERLAIYNRAFFYRQLEAVASVFAATQRALGEAEFTRLGLAYLAAHPSEHPAVERVGRRFPEYLAKRVVAPIADIAALEWAHLCALVAPNPVALAPLRGIDHATFPRCRVKLVPSLSFMELDSRALSALRPGGSIAAPGVRTAVAVFRAARTVQHERLDLLEFKALAAADAGATMAEVCALFDTGDPEADVRRAFSVISSWYARSWLERVEISGA